MSFTLRSALIVLVCLLIPAATLAAGRGREASPVLVTRVHGETFAGPRDVTLTVWYSGDAVLAGDDNLNGAQVCRTAVSPEVVDNLKRALLRAGAGRLRGRIVDGTADVPDTTVTFFLEVESSRQSVANTFTFNVSEGGYEKVQAVIKEFRDDALPYPDCVLVFI